MLWAMAIGACGLAFAIGGIAMGGSPKEKSTDFTVPASETAEGVAKCKRGQEAVAGGFADPLDFLGGRLILGYDSARDGKRGWRHRAGSFSATDQQAAVFAYCDSDKPHLKARSATETSDGDEISATARCRRGETVVSGGFSSTAVDDFVVPTASKRVGKRRWESSLYNGGDDPIQVTAFAYCHEDGSRLKARSATATLDSPPNTGSVAAKCKRGRRVVSGGFDSEFSLSPFTQAFISGSQRTSRREWEVTAGVGMSFPVEVTAYAYCEKKGKK